MQIHDMTLPVSKESLRHLCAGDQVRLSGSLLGLRDHAHQKLYEFLEQSLPWPVSFQNETIYYVGPSPGFSNYVVGAAGPTTSSRMDAYTPMMLEHGVVATIGKGDRSEAVKRCMLEHGCVYLAAVGGIGALLGRCVTAFETIAFPELGPEAIFRIHVHNFPVIVAFDTEGHDLFQRNRI